MMVGTDDIQMLYNMICYIRELHTNLSLTIRLFFICSALKNGKYSKVVKQQQHLYEQTDTPLCFIFLWCFREKLGHKVLIKTARDELSPKVR